REGAGHQGRPVRSVRDRRRGQRVAAPVADARGPHHRGGKRDARREARQGPSSAAQEGGREEGGAGQGDGGEEDRRQEDHGQEGGAEEGRPQEGDPEEGNPLVRRSRTYRG